MPKQKPPAFQFYVRDWLTDTELGQCSPATRGIWIDMLANMWVARQRGKLEGTIQSIARLCRCSESEALEAINELEQTSTADIMRSVTRNGKVTGCHKKVTLGCRRMLREEAERKSNADRQKRHREKESRKSNGNSNTEVTFPSASSSSSSSSSAVLKRPPIPPKSAVSDEVKQRLAELLETWPAIYAKRFGRQPQAGHEHCVARLASENPDLTAKRFGDVLMWQWERGQYTPTSSLTLARIAEDWEELETRYLNDGKSPKAGVANDIFYPEEDIEIPTG